MSLHDDLMHEVGAPILMEYHGTQNAVVLHLGAHDVPLREALLGSIDYQAEYDPEAGRTVKRATRTVYVRTDLLTAKGVSELPERFTATVEGVEWAHAVSQSKWSPTVVTIALERATLARVSTGERRSGSV